MSRLATTVLLATGLVLGLGSAARAAETDMHVVSVDTDAYPQVRVVVAPPESLAGSTLSTRDFTVTESGRRAKAAVTPLSSDALDVVLLIDTSGSMRPAIDQAKAASKEFIAAMPPSTRFAVVTFGSEVHAALTRSDGAAAAATVDSLTVSGETALYDGLIAAAGQLPKGGSVVLLSDGGDTASQADLAAAATSLNQQNADLYAISLVTPESNAKALDLMVDAVGGRHVSVDDAPGLSAVYRGVAAQLTHQYAVSYRSGLTRDSELTIAVRKAGEHAEVSTTIDAPANAAPALAAARPAAPVATTPTVVAAPSGTRAGWALAAGAAAFFGSLLVLGWMLSAPRQRRRSLSLEAGIRRIPGPRAAFNDFSEKAAEFADRTLEKRGQRRTLYSALERGGIPVRPGEFVVLVAGLALGAGLIVSLLLGANVLVFVIVVGAVILGARAYVSRRANQRREAFCSQLADTLQVMSGHLRTGYGLLQAVDVVANESEEPTSTEFQRLVTENRLGRDMSEALRAMSARIGSEDFEWVVQAIDVHREVGGDLAEVLDNVAETIRDRDHVRRQVKALSADGRLSAYVLVALPFVVFAGLKVLNPDYMNELFTSVVGKLMIVGALSLIGIGALWLRRVVRLQF